MIAPLVAMRSQFAADVNRGLSAQTGKSLPPQYFYDDVGSALFDVITLLPEYGLTRADEGLLARYACKIIARFGEARLTIELGSGSGGKTRHLLEAAVRSHAVRYFPIDVSASALARCREALEGIQGVSIFELNMDYFAGLREAIAQRRAEEKVLVLFLGSTIGNFHPTEAVTFLQAVRAELREGDGLLLGTDMIKPEAQLLQAYDDALGVTASFNLNVLARINRELGGHFNLKQFQHEARWNQSCSRVEMHLRSLQDQTVRIDQLDLEFCFTAGETIWTESSHKFNSEQIENISLQAGFDLAQQWLDQDWGFAETLLLARA